MTRVLIVDDEESARVAVGAACESENIIVEQAHSVASAKIRLKNAKQRNAEFDAVLLDLEMPGKTGDQLVPEIRREFPFMTVIILTAYATVGTAVATLRNGAYQYLTKPCDARKHIIPVIRAGVAEKRLEKLRYELLEPEPPKDLFSQVAQVIQEAMPKASHFVLAIMSPDDDALRVEVACNESGKIPWEGLLHKDHPLVRRVYQGQEVVHCSSKREIGKWEPLTKDAKSLIAAPIRTVGGGLEGLVSLECREEITFDQHTKDVLLGVAELISIERGVRSRVQAEAARVEAEAARKEAQHLSESAHQCAHFIRNSVHHLRGSFGLLREASAMQSPNIQEVSARVSEHLQLENCCDEIEDVLMQLAAIGKPIQPQRVAENLIDILKPRQPNYQAMAEHANVKLLINPTPESIPESIPVVADPKLLRWAVDMLVENAIEACASESDAADPTVRLDVSRRKSMARVRVRDNGPGISHDDFEHLFKPQFSTKQYTPLRGIGLYTAKRIALEHGGKIWANEAVAAGAEFVLELPLDPSQA